MEEATKEKREKKIGLRRKEKKWVSLVGRGGRQKKDFSFFKI